MKSTLVLTMTFLLLTIFASTVTQPHPKTANGQLSGVVPVASGKTMFYNFTSDHLFVEDEGDWYSEGIEVDIEGTYVVCDGEFIYILWLENSPGSHIDEIYFDVGEGNGYQVDDISATYLVHMSGLLKWNGTDFQLLTALNEAGSNFWQSEDGKVACHCFSDLDEKSDYWEFKIALSVLDSPQAIKIIQRVKYAGCDQAPDDSFILIYLNQSQCLIASFYAKTVEFEGRDREIRRESIGYYSEGFNASLKLMNFGNSSLGPLNVSLNLPKQLTANLNKTFWEISLEQNKCWNLQFKLRPERLGEFNLTATMISSNESKNVFSQIMPLKITVIPKMGVSIQPSEQMEAGIPNKLNITVANHEAKCAEVSVVTYGQYKECWYLDPLTLELSPNSSVKIKTEIAPLAVVNPVNTNYNYSFLEIALEFKGLPICSSGSFPFPCGPIEIIKPNVEITVDYPKKVMVGNSFYINISIFNNESKDILTCFNVWVWEWDSERLVFEGDTEYKEQTASVAPNSSITFTFKFKAVKESSPRHAYVSFHIQDGFYGDDIRYKMETVSYLTLILPALRYLIIAIIVAIIIGLIIFCWRKHQRELRIRKRNFTGKPL